MSKDFEIDLNKLSDHEVRKLFHVVADHLVKTRAKSKGEKMFNNLPETGYARVFNLNNTMDNIIMRLHNVCIKEEDPRNVYKNFKFGDHLKITMSTTDVKSYIVEFYEIEFDREHDGSVLTLPDRIDVGQFEITRFVNDVLETLRIDMGVK